MKFCIVLIGILIGSQAFNLSRKQFEEIFKITNSGCLESTHVNVSLAAGLFYDNKITDVDEKLKDFLFCFNKNKGIQDNQGHINKDVLRRNLFFNSTINDAIVEKCTEYKGTPQETAYQYMKCAFKITGNE